MIYLSITRKQEAKKTYCTKAPMLEIAVMSTPLDTVSNIFQNVLRTSSV